MISSWFESRPLAVLRGTTRGAGEQTVGGLRRDLELGLIENGLGVLRVVQPGHSTSSNLSPTGLSCPVRAGHRHTCLLLLTVRLFRGFFGRICVRPIRTEAERHVSGKTFCATGPWPVAAPPWLRRQHRRRVATPDAPRCPRAAPQQPTDQARLVFGL